MDSLFLGSKVDPPLPHHYLLCLLLIPLEMPLLEYGALLQAMINWQMRVFDRETFIIEFESTGET